MAAPPPRPPNEPRRPAYYGQTRRRPPPPGRLDFLKGAFAPLGSRVLRMRRRIKKTGGLQFYRLLTLTGVLILIAAAITGIVMYAARNNANEVYTGETRAGVIKMNKKITAETLKNLAVNKIESEIGMRISVFEEVYFKPAHASSKNIMTEEQVIAVMAGAFTYTVEAAEIHVDGERYAVLKNAAEAETVRDNIIEAYVQEGSVIIEKGFVEDFLITLNFVDRGELMDSDRAYRELTRTTGTQQNYTVRKGDTLWQISVDTGMSMDDLYSLNPGLTQNIFVGQTIVLTALKPVLSVRTVEEVTHTEVVPKTIEYIQNNTQLKSYSRVIQQGRDGQQDVISHIERVNGFTIGSVMIDYTITTPAVPDIIEVGTK